MCFYFRLDYSGQKKKLNGPGVANNFFPKIVRPIFLPKLYWYRSSASFPMGFGFFGWVTDFLWFFFHINLKFQKLQINEKEWELVEQNAKILPESQIRSIFPFSLFIFSTFAKMFDVFLNLWNCFDIKKITLFSIMEFCHAKSEFC